MRENSFGAFDRNKKDNNALQSGLRQRERYSDQDLIRYAEVGEIQGDVDKLERVERWLRILLDALSSRQAV